MSKKKKVTIEIEPVHGKVLYAVRVNGHQISAAYTPQVATTHADIILNAFLAAGLGDSLDLIMKRRRE